MVNKTSFNSFRKLYMSKELSDVTLVIGTTEIPAHRQILSHRSEYFKAMFSSNFVESKCEKVVLKDTNLDVFKNVLKYIYTGSMQYIYYLPNSSSSTFNDVFAILVCARYYLVDGLVAETVHVVKHNCSYFETLNNAIEFSFEELIVYSTNFIKNDSSCICKNKLFEQLSPMAVEHLLKARLNMQESIIFEALVRWMRANSDNSHVFPKLLEHIDLYLLEEEQLEALVEPIQLVDRSCCKNLLKHQREMAQNVLKIVNQNVINGVKDLRIVEGDIHWFTTSGIVSVQPDDQRNCIIVDLKRLFLLNCIKFETKYDVSYTVSISRNMREWTGISDHSQYTCFGPQVLYFLERDVRFICFKEVGDDWLHVNANIEALYSTNPSEIDFTTTLIIPNQNIMPANMVLRWGSNVASAFIDGEETKGHMQHWIGHGCIIFQLSQPYIIGSMKLLLKERSSYYIEISINRKFWTRVFAEKDTSGWRIATFLKQPVVFIKIVGTKASSKYFHLFQLECPAT